MRFFEPLGLFTYYKPSGVLEAIEFVSPQNRSALE